TRTGEPVRAAPHRCLAPAAGLALLIEGAKTHQNPYVRARSGMLLDGYDVSDQEIEMIREVLRMIQVRK
ncbi:MAG: hypothetical protein ACR2IV_19990, partial [Bryobacteraceae bacterium]